MLKKILLALILVVATTIAHADDDMKTAASKAYVDTSVETLQDKIPAANQPNVGAGETVMTYTAAGNGQIGERGIYTGANGYDASTDADKLITASALNDTFTNLHTTDTTKLECANLNDGCTLWTIVDQTAYYHPSRNLFNPNSIPENFGAYYGVSLAEYMGKEYYIKIYRKPGAEVPSGTFGVVYKYAGGDPSAVWFVTRTSGETEYYTNGTRVLRVLLHPEDLVYLALAVYPANQATWDSFLAAYDIQLEQGTSPTPYEPYY